jgi:hypothetical protein
MRVLIACEFSGIVREAFARRGHDAMSCDLLPTEIPGNHYQGDVMDIINDGWDLMIAHPPCTYLASSGARWFSGNIDRHVARQEAIDFVEWLWYLPIDRIAIENPIGFLSTMSKLAEPDQIIQPWMFGHGETKSTCLWLKNLPPLKATNIVDKRDERIHKLSALRGPGSSKTRQQDRSRTFPGIAEAMAEQWGKQ